ncbi:hypothetical protein GCM10027429_22960 [Marivirga atlantica]|jgi:acetyl esterase/lipase|uniref:Alpha/beta hydrolase n=1 Tax=Marivirga atlantica TaxID=1548457 RepID=A0A937ABR1_9BACT|nr:alpha/beta hydrolase [Marivirga atlantica]MBL0765915.1 alpha/beta hydrolase [Marivirga atlantica]
MNKAYIFLFAISIFLLPSCGVFTVNKSKDIPYMAQGQLDNLPEKSLNIFFPKNKKECPVVVFAYGGSWESGKKELYSFLGKRLAKKGIVAVIIDYPLSPAYKVPDMALSVAQSVKWTVNNIANYHGNPDRIFVSGHSAGGHLTALNTLKDDYFDQLCVENPIKGAILIDAAGIDMYTYLKEKKLASGESYLKAFTNDPAVWKDTSPIYYLDNQDPQCLIMMGGKTYPGIKSSTERFLDKSEEIGYEPIYHLQPSKKHVPMITQFIWSGNKTYDWIEEFVKAK